MRGVDDNANHLSSSKLFFCRFGVTGQVSGRRRLASSFSQRGSEINWGTDLDYTGYSVAMSADGSIVAIGAPKYNGTNTTFIGVVRVYQWNNSNFTQLGSDIIGEADGEKSGHSVALSADGSILAIGAPYNDGPGGSTEDVGVVRVYQLSNDDWVRLGDDINGRASKDLSGYSVALSGNGNRLAVGAPLALEDGGENIWQLGSVRVYEWSNNSWTQLDDPIWGARGTENAASLAEEYGPQAGYSWMGHSVALSDAGDIVAVGAPFLEAPFVNQDIGYVQVYQLTEGKWTQMGRSIMGDGENYTLFGWSVALSADGSTVAAGAPGMSYVQVHKWSDGSWTQLGKDITGNEYDFTGSSVALNSDGEVLAVGASRFWDGGDGNGQVQVFQYGCDTWTEIGININASSDANMYEFGYSVALSTDGAVMAAGDPQGWNGGKSRCSTSPCLHSMCGTWRIRRGQHGAAKASPPRCPRGWKCSSPCRTSRGMTILLLHRAGLPSHVQPH